MRSILRETDERYPDDEERIHNIADRSIPKVGFHSPSPAADRNAAEATTLTEGLEKKDAKRLAIRRAFDFDLVRKISEWVSVM
jgi:hypothetical protein